MQAQKVLLSFLFSQMAAPKAEEFFRLLSQLEQGMMLQDLELWIDPSALAPLRTRWCERVSQMLEALQAYQQQGIHFTYPGSPDFPAELLSMSDPPYFLSYYGKPVWLEQPSFAIVGSRELSARGELWCEQILPQVIRELPMTVVSGGARGVDQVAHRTALRAGRPTLALIPSGLRQIYPEAFAQWARPIADAGGAVISEFAPSAEMRKHYFVRRNRLISGLGVATLVVEARRKSGSLLTARHTLEQGKPLFVLPSHPMDSENLGALDLMLEGATPVRDAQDLILLLRSEMDRAVYLQRASGLH